MNKGMKEAIDTQKTVKKKWQKKKKKEKYQKDCVSALQLGSRQNL